MDSSTAAKLAVLGGATAVVAGAVYLSTTRKPEESVLNNNGTAAQPGKALEEEDTRRPEIPAVRAPAVVNDASPKTDGITALMHAADAFADVSVLVKPSSKQAQFAEGSINEYLTVESGQAHGHRILSLLKAGKRVAVHLHSADLIALIPLMYEIAEANLPAVFHVITAAGGTSLGPLESVLSARQSGFAFVNSQSVQEAHDMAVVSHLAAAASSSPVLHFLDTATATAGAKGVKLIPAAQLRRMAETKHDAIDKTTALQHVMDANAGVLSAAYSSFEYVGSATASTVVVAIGSTAAAAADNLGEYAAQGVLKVRTYRPWDGAALLAALPTTAAHVVVLDKPEDGSAEWGSIFVDVLTAVQEASVRPDVESLPYPSTARPATSVDMMGVLDSLARTLDSLGGSTVPASNMETPYLRMLEQTFKARLSVSNASGAPSIWGDSAGPAQDADNIEFGYGVLLAKVQQRKEMIAMVSRAVADLLAPLDDDVRDILTLWLAKRDDPEEGPKVTAAAIELLGKMIDVSHEDVRALVESRELLAAPSQWLVGGSNWAYDLSLSGIHHVIASGQNINLLIVDSEEYTGERNVNGGWKKDIGLYAMNYGDVYVGSIAAASWYTHALRVVQEADAFTGPSIVLAYAPQAPSEVRDQQSRALFSLKAAKVAVDTGRWPLYRWNPSSSEPFTLDSAYMREQLQKFLDRDNHLSMLAKEVPAVSASLASTLDSKVGEQHEKLHKESVDAYLELLKGLQGERVRVLFTYASDGGNAEGVARKLLRGATARGLDATLAVMDDLSIQDLAEEDNVVCVLSTAGQGEFPGNGKNFYKQLVADGGTGMLASVNFAVFGLGDSLYWPRPGEEHYFCKPATQLDGRLAELDATRLVDVALGDDQADDGYNTALAEWEPRLWSALGVSVSVDGLEDAPPPALLDDDIKINSNYLRGTIAEALLDETTGSIPMLDTKIIKFHGSYMQDDRDLRESRREQGLENAFSFMIRVRVPSGVCTPAQYIAMDDLGASAGNGTLKLTTRQAFQLHGVIKKELKATMAAINQTLMDTLAACGDVNRNVMGPANPVHIPVETYDEITKFACDLSAHLSPRTSAYHEIWLDKKQVAGFQDEEPMYGETYLPRKFKIAICVPPDNDTDVFAHCLCYIAILDEDHTLLGFNVVVGGGMGMHHNNKKTYPCTGQILGFVPLDKAIKLAEAVLLTQRDLGERVNRKHARFKYTVEDHGLDKIREEVEARLGSKLQEARPYVLTNNGDRLGWNQTSDGNYTYGLFIENGRIKDVEGYPLKTGLRAIAEVHTGDFRLTGTANLIIGRVTEENKALIERLLAEHNIGNDRFSGLRKNAMACAALPYCALAMAESERYLPSLIIKLEDSLEEAGLRDDAITMRMTGCPNGCARPYIAEIALVGKAPGTYNLYLGAGHAGERLNKLYRPNVQEDDVIAILGPMFKQYAKERHEGEWFGDFVIRAGHVAKTIRGPDFHENVVL